MTVEKLDRLGDGDLRRVALELLDLAARRHQRIEIEEVRHRNPFVEAERAGAARIVGQDRRAGPAEAVEMPFAEMAGHVARRLQRLGDRLLLQPQRVAVAEHARAIVRAAGQHAGPRRRTDRAAGVEPLEAQPVGRHRVEVRRLEHRMIAIAGLPPAHVVGHDEDDVGTRRCSLRRRTDDDGQKQDCWSQRDKSIHSIRSMKNQ